MNQKNKIAIDGNLPWLPPSFPLTKRENSGNMIHARSPGRIFGDKAVYNSDPSRPWGSGSFSDWANSNASHVVFTLANTIRLDKNNDELYERTMRRLDAYSCQLVIFGLGAQAPHTDLSELTITPGAATFMRYLGERCSIVGVRGKFTQDVFAMAGVTNTMIVGCPSLFAEPQAVSQLKETLSSNPRGKRSFAGTLFSNPVEADLLIDSIRSDQFLVEPVNHHHHRLFIECAGGRAPSNIPEYLLAAIEARDVSFSQVCDYFARNYRLFRHVEPWFEFNRELVSFTYGTRFHVNMAAHICGVPAMWLTHDSRTSEMCEYMHLPSIPLARAANMRPAEIQSAYDADDFFEHIGLKFQRFNEYLDHYGLVGPKLRF